MNKSFKGVSNKKLKKIIYAKKLKLACKFMGAVVCKFPPDGDECETCEKPNLQHYYIRECYEYDEGSYHCADCIINNAEHIRKENEALEHKYK